MKKLTAILLIAVLAALLLCACGDEPQVTEKITSKYPGTYLYENSTIRERSSRTLKINEDGTYSYDRVSTLPWVNGSFTGTWKVDEKGYIILTADGSGQFSRGMLSEDTLLLNISDVNHGEDTVGDGIYRYQFPENPATPDDAG